MVIHNSSNSMQAMLYNAFMVDNVLEFLCIIIHAY